MQILNKMMKNSPLYKSNTQIKPQGLMLHSVGCPQPKADVFIDQMDKSSANKGVQAFIDAEGKVHQTLPINFTKKTAVKNWHCGSGKNGSGNNKWIGVEMTEPATIKYTKGSSFKDLNPEETKKFVNATYKTAVEYFAYLCKGYGFDPLENGVIVSHSEGCKMGYASNHSDVEHIWSKYGLTMNKFRKDVAAKMENTKVNNKNTSVTVTVAANSKNVTEHYMITSGDGLNIRAGAGTSYKKTGALSKNNKVTITKVSANGNWGYLSSGKGWICISSKYVKKISRVQVTCSSLNIRKKGTILSSKVGSLKKGVKQYITKTSGSWGYIDGAGWINISSKYVKKI